MRTRHLALLLVGTALWALLRVVLCYDEAPWQPVLYDYYHIDLGELSGNQDQGPIGNSRSKIPAPMDAVVDVINDLGIKLLAIHNERNENNIAISPYGAFSVLAALSEGLQGDSVHEILHSARIPHDKQMVRVGLRDIHRHLKSYFIPEEGFLAGLTLNLNNVSLKSEYEDVLRFYGFDYGSFNNALYPDPPTTRKTTEGTTLETGFGVSDDSTTESAPTTTEKATEVTTEGVLGVGGPDIPATTTTAEPPATTTTTTVPTTTTEVEIVEDREELTTTTTVPPTTAATTDLPTTTEATTTAAPGTETSVETLEISGTSSATTPNEELGTKGTSKASTAARVTSVTSSSQSKTGTGLSTTKMFETTAELHSTTASDSETLSTNVHVVTVLPPSTTSALTDITTSSGNTIRSTREIATSTVAPETTTTSQTTMTPTAANTVLTNQETVTLMQSTLPPVTTTPMETTTQSTSSEIVTATTQKVSSTDSTIITSTESMETTQSPPTSSSKSTLNMVDQENTVVTAPMTKNPLNTIQPETTSQLLDDQTQETTTSFFFGTTPEFQENPQSEDNLDPNYNYEDTNNAAPVYDDIAMTLMPPQDAANANLKRSVRSPVVDYVIARYKCRMFYDEQPQFVSLSQRMQYVPEEGTTFAVYGKYREPAAFMKYDTVLPYMFVPNLNAIALSFPLDSTKYYLLLLLPLRDDGIDQLICDLRLYGNLRYIVENLRLTHVEAIIPSFTLKGYVTLTPTLQKLGIHKIFEPRQSDFSPMTNASDIYVTNIEQAVTVTIRNYLDPSAQRYKNLQQYPPVHFKADHPFLYFVVDSELHVALMVGKVINPLNTRIS